MVAPPGSHLILQVALQGQEGVGSPHLAVPPQELSDAGRTSSATVATPCGCLSVGLSGGGKSGNSCFWDLREARGSCVPSGEGL